MIVYMNIEIITLLMSSIALSVSILILMIKPAVIRQRYKNTLTTQFKYIKLIRITLISLIVIVLAEFGSNMLDDNKGFLSILFILLIFQLISIKEKSE